METNVDGAVEYVRSLGYHPTYCAVYGSQNYGLEIDGPDYHSDVDYKCVVLPSLEDLVWNRKPVSTVVEFEGGQIDVKDVRNFMDSVVKVNVNFIETLATDLYWSDGNWTAPRVMLGDLMSSLGNQYMKACYGMMTEKYHALDKEYPSTKHKVDEFGYDPKQLHHIMRLHELMVRYVMKDFPNFIHDDDRAMVLKKIKVDGMGMDKALAFEIAEHEMRSALGIRDAYEGTDTYDIKEKYLEWSRNLVLNHVRKCT